MTITYKDLIQKGAKVVAPLKYYAARSKVCGCMWEGEATLELDRVEYYLKMWWHGPDPDKMTQEMAEEVCSLYGMQVGGEWLDTYWHTICRDGMLWYHPEGWFRNRKLKELVEGDVWHPRENDCLKRSRPFDVQLAKKLGFLRIL